MEPVLARDEISSGLPQHPVAARGCSSACAPLDWAQTAARSPDGCGYAARTSSADCHSSDLYLDLLHLPDYGPDCEPRTDTSWARPGASASSEGAVLPSLLPRPPPGHLDAPPSQSPWEQQLEPSSPAVDFEDFLEGLPSPPRCPPLCSCVLCSLPPVPAAPLPSAEAAEASGSEDWAAALPEQPSSGDSSRPPQPCAPPSSAPASLPAQPSARPLPLAARLAALVQAASSSKSPAAHAAPAEREAPSPGSIASLLARQGPREEEVAPPAAARTEPWALAPAPAATMPLALAPTKRSRGVALLPPPPSGAADPAMLRLRLPQVTRGGALRLVDVAAVCSAQPRGAAVAEAGGAGVGPFAGAPPPVLRVPWRLGPQAELLELSLPEDVGWEGALPARRLRPAEGQGGAEERWRDLQALAPGGVEEGLKKRLLTLAEAVATHDEALFSLYLRLLQADASPCGSPMQRIAHYFTQALQARAKGTAMHMQFDRMIVPDNLVSSLVQCVCSLPYMEFKSRGLSYPIMAALEGAPVVHIVDFGCWRRQWVAVLKHLAERSPLLPPDPASASLSCSRSCSATGLSSGHCEGHVHRSASCPGVPRCHCASCSTSQGLERSGEGVAAPAPPPSLLSPYAWLKGCEHPCSHEDVAWPPCGPQPVTPRNPDGSALRRRLHVRFTAVEMPNEVPVAVGPSQPASHLQEELSLAAAELGISLEFHTLRCSVHEFAARMVQRQPGEALAVCCALQMDAVADDNMARGGVRERFLQEIAQLAPRVVTAAHICLNTNMPFFLRRFSNSLDFYSSLFSSFDAGGPRDSFPRQVFESIVMARPLINTVACEGSRFFFRSEPLRQTRARFRRAGFVPAPYPQWALAGMERMLALYPKGFRVELNFPGDIPDDLAPIRDGVESKCIGSGSKGHVQETGMTIFWQGIPCFRTTAWLPPRTLPL